MQIRDQIGRVIEIPEPPKRIVCLVPSLTELLVDLGLSDRIVGVTKFCVHPKDLRKDKAVVGGTKSVHFDKIAALRPDIILYNKEENTKEMVTALERAYTVHVSDINTMEEALSCIVDYGTIFGVAQTAKTLVASISEKQKDFQAFSAALETKRVAYFIWKDPWIVVGKDTFINHMLKLVKFDNVYAAKSRYPEITLAELEAITDLDAVLLSSEPFPFKEKHIQFIQQKLPNVSVYLVDGEYFSWYGSRLYKAFTYFKALRAKL
ncbi:helical backbone metal receptor [Aquimarina brevivitae]|uniref:ABC-type Fe3+-hydroxamate transport system substrate-binding protein n=1 Tax=Aquimarina brevivitae TaxID=323412 RepID=A0A4Q7PJH2_9FLAO|nr:helical backbone metal receptor [Aquimarina brevivitae]RZT00199.1 ABC-type Fe3+-hydroxamate transport system substrate-binding protein [Aquimarina brevivitae]